MLLFFVGSLIKARRGCNNYLADSNYETDVELGRGQRKRKNRVPVILDDDDEEDQTPLKRSTKEIPPPPIIKPSVVSNQKKAALEKVKKDLKADAEKRQKIKEIVTKKMGGPQEIKGKLLGWFIYESC